MRGSVRPLDARGRRLHRVRPLARPPAGTHTSAASGRRPTIAPRGSDWVVQGRDLSGTCGIPRECDRVYVKVDVRQGPQRRCRCAQKGSYGQTEGAGQPESTARHVTHGRVVFGNLVERFDVFMGHTGELKTIWRRTGAGSSGNPAEESRARRGAKASRSPSLSALP